MSLPEIIFIGVGLSMDCFAVSVSCSVQNKNISFFQALYIAFFFALFQAGMPVLGWLTASSFKEYIIIFDHLIAFGILGFIGGKMMIESFSKKEKEDVSITSLWIILSLSIATSIDALIVGVGMAFMDLNIWFAISVIGVITLFNAMVGFKLGKYLGSVFGKRAEFLGGLVLLLIGVKILVEHLIL